MIDYNLFPYQASENIKPSVTIPWNITQTNAPAFWPFAHGIAPVGAVIDTGIDTAHAEFAGRIFMPKSVDGTPMSDSVGHGTHVAGTIAGATKGMMPWARIMPLKITFGSGQTNIQIWDAFLAILDHNRECKDEDKVVAVNCSFDGPADAMMNYYIRALVESDVTVVVAAGNRGDGDPNTHECFGYPAYLYEVITTAALNQDNSPAGFSSSFDGVDLSAPGADIISAAPGGGFVALSGTSMATPHVTGAILLIKAAFRKKYTRWPTTDETEAILWKCIKPLPSDSRLTGRGALNLLGQIVTTQTKQADVAPYIKDGRTQVSLRFVAEALGAEVDGSRLPFVTAELGDKKITLLKDSKGYSVDTKLF
jgi:major intracellular serine protease